jgi:subtilase family serine protease
MHFSNFNNQSGAEVTYRVYKLGTTSNWGGNYSTAQLQPWFNELYQMSITGKISEDEYREAESEWLRQLTD